MVVKRITKPQISKSIKYLAGVKTRHGNDFETNPGIYNTEGILISIIPDKINSDGWRVKVDDYKTFDCTYTSDVRIMPDYIIRGDDEWIPKNTVKAQVSVDTVMRTYNILKLTIGEEIPVELDPETTNITHKDKSSVVLSSQGVSLNGENLLINGETIDEMVETAITEFEENNNLTPENTNIIIHQNKNAGG